MITSLLQEHTFFVWTWTENNFIVLRNWKSMLYWSIQIKSHVICALFGDQCQGKIFHQKLKFRFAGMFLLMLIDRAPWAIIIVGSNIVLKHEAATKFGFWSSVLARQFWTKILIINLLKFYHALPRCQESWTILSKTFWAVQNCSGVIGWIISKDEPGGPLLVTPLFSTYP